MPFISLSCVTFLFLQLNDQLEKHSAWYHSDCPVSLSCLSVQARRRWLQRPSSSDLKVFHVFSFICGENVWTRTDPRFCHQQQGDPELLWKCLILYNWQNMIQLRIENACSHSDKPARMSSLKCWACDTAAMSFWQKLLDVWKKTLFSTFLICNVFLQYCAVSPDGFTHLGLLHLDL